MSIKKNKYKVLNLYTDYLVSCLTYTYVIWVLVEIINVSLLERKNEKHFVFKNSGRPLHLFYI